MPPGSPLFGPEAGKERELVDIQLKVIFEPQRYARLGKPKAHHARTSANAVQCTLRAANP